MSPDICFCTKPKQSNLCGVKWTASQTDTEGTSCSFAGPALPPQAFRAREVLQSRVEGGSWSNPRANGPGLDLLKNSPQTMAYVHIGPDQNTCQETHVRE